MSYIFVGAEIPLEDIWRTEIIKGCKCAVEHKIGQYCPMCGTHDEEEVEAELFTSFARKLISRHCDDPDNDLLATEDLHKLYNYTFDGYTFVHDSGEDTHFFGKEVWHFDTTDFSHEPLHVAALNKTHQDVYESFSKFPPQLLAYDFKTWLIG
jgi:hypothetical protein